MNTFAKALRSFRWAFSLALLYGLLSLAWSALGLLTPTAPAHLHEYPLRGLLVEVGGHVLFGLVAGLPTLDLGLMLLCGGEAILIDADHLLGALNLPVQTRLSHSIGFMVLGPLAMGRVGRRWYPGKAIAIVTLSSILAHLSYDLFAGNAPVPILDPFALTFFAFPSWTWAPLEGAAMASCAYLGLVSRKKRISALKAIKTPEDFGTR